ncbi:hypothetical protein J5Y09_00045 [Roseomonas sp. PWR1]|uniref:Cupin domain-containing protein n=1 Tax=Roseomonas nitratireducens TaxID=2820810 RepID=A0ABS4ALP7_9PROT|nr:hypothetical protein [Neoroseomonas nitratireducens]MBP0462286.1 hypothetical protein [Neoroseomonas nitratireducens]
MRVTAGEVHQFEDGEGWFHLPGAPEGVAVRILANSLDPTTGRGARVQMLRLPPGGTLPEAPPSEGDYWQEYLLLRGEVSIDGHPAPLHAPAALTIAHGARRATLASPGGCLLVEVAHY